MIGWDTALAALLGAAAGMLLPAAGDRIARYKRQKKGRALEAAPLYTGAAAMAACALANGLGWALCWQGGTPLAAVLAALIFTNGILLMLLDLRLRILPNELVALGAALGIAFQLAAAGPGGLPTALFAMLLIAMVFLLLGNVMGLDKVGAGDVKLAAVLGLTLGYPYAMVGLVAMAGSLALFCLAGLALRRLTLKSMIPFGPFLVPGLQIGLLALLLAAGR
jgi:leader peptidase (prepilin peptidase)/N-methyltransferase